MTNNNILKEFFDEIQPLVCGSHMNNGVMDSSSSFKMTVYTRHNHLSTKIQAKKCFARYRSTIIFAGITSVFFVQIRLGRHSLLQRVDETFDARVRPSFANFITNTVPIISAQCFVESKINSGISLFTIKVKVIFTCKRFAPDIHMFLLFVCLLVLKFRRHGSREYCMGYISMLFPRTIFCSKSLYKNPNHKKMDIQGGRSKILSATSLYVLFASREVSKQYSIYEPLKKAAGRNNISNTLEPSQPGPLSFIITQNMKTHHCAGTYFGAAYLKVPLSDAFSKNKMR